MPIAPSPSAPVIGPQSTLPLETLGKNGKPPRTRLSDPDKAATIVYNLIEANRDRQRRYAMQRAMIDGNPPFNPAKLRSAAQSNRTNFNTLEGKATISAALVPFYDLFAGSPTFIDVQTAHGNPKDRDRYSAIINEELDLTLKDDPDFDLEVWSMLFDYVAFGRGYLMWEDATDWRFHHVPQQHLLVPDGTRASLDKLQVFVIRWSYQVHELYRFIADEAHARQVGWKLDAVKQAIRLAVPEDPTLFNDYTMVQQELKDHDLVTSTRSSVIQAAHVFVREFDDTWTHLIVTENNNPPGFLFEHRGRFNHVTQVLAPFFFEILDGSWNGLSGLAKDIFAPMQIKDRIRCSGIDALFMRTSLVLQPKGPLDKTKMGLAQIGPITWLPENATVQQSTILGDIDSTIAYNRDLDAMLTSNTGIYRPRLEKEAGNPRTAEEVRLQFANSTVLGNSAVNRFYNQLDRMYAELYRRISNPNQSIPSALSFQQRCLKRGVPKIALMHVLHVRALRNIGNGSNFMRQQALAGMMSVYQLLPEDGKDNLIDDFISVTANQSKVDRYAPRASREKLPDDHTELALLENAAIKIGAPVTWTPSQNNTIHAQTHLHAGAKALQSLQQGGDPSEVLHFLDGLGGHTAIHLKKIGGDPTRKDVYAALEKQWKQMATLADKLRKQVAGKMQSQAKARAISQGTDPDTKLKEAETFAKIKLAGIKTAAGLKQKAQKHEQGMAIADAEAAADITRKRFTAFSPTTP